MRKTWTAAAVLAMTGLLMAAGRPGVLRTKDGNRYEGTIDEQAETVVVNVRGIDTNVPRANIESITYGEFDERWNEAYDKLDPKDDAGRVQAARRAFDEKRYDLAEKAVRDALAINPNNAQAAELLTTIQSQRRLDRATTPTVGTGGVATPDAAVKPTGGWNILDGNAINRIKQLEMTDRDARLRIAFSNNVLKRYYDATPTLAATYPNFNAFRTEMPMVQAQMILTRGPADMAKDVKVNNDPEVITTFRRDVMPAVLQGCATSVCHGGNNAASEKFALITPAADPGSTYTNFYVLQAYSTRATGATTKRADGSVDAPPEVGRMIDRMQPDQSLLLQYGLPEGAAQIKHPRVRGYTGLFARGREDARYQSVRTFIASLTPVQPDYGVDFKLTRKDAPGASTRP